MDFDELRDDSDRLEALSRRQLARLAAGRDRQLALFRRVWEACKPGDKNELKMVLHALAHAHDRLGRATGWRLAVPGVELSDFEGCPDEVFDDSNDRGLDRELSQIKNPHAIDPAEYLCAIACWEAGEEYVPCAPLRPRHPRWPYLTPFGTAKEPGG